jgi:hypothetical protein
MQLFYSTYNSAAIITTTTTSSSSSSSYIHKIAASMVLGLA